MKDKQALGRERRALGRLTGELARALLVALALLAALELALAALGAGGRPERVVGPLGYEAGAAYFLPDPAREGGWRTRFLQQYPPDFAIPPKGARPRVLISGASTAHSFWAGRLGTQLGRALGRGPFEEVNVGRGGYGSERVAIVLEQALERLEPDFVFVYTGDNEFVEVPPARRPRSWTERAADLRTVRAITGLAGLAADPVPEPWIPFHGPPVLDVRFPETLERLEGLRANLRRICRLATERGVPLALSTVVYNRMCAPFVSSLPADFPAHDRAELERLLEEALGLLPDFLGPLVTRDPRDRVQIADWTVNEEPGESPRARWELPGRRPSFGPLADQKPYGTQPWEWGEKVWTLFEALERFHARELEPGQLADLERAEELLRAVLALSPDHPGAHYELALVGYLLERDPGEVRRLLERAADLDRLPLKGSERINAIVREVAAEFPEVLLFDADRLLASRVPAGIVGWEWMLDHSHIAKGARVVLMKDLAAAAARRWPHLGAAPAAAE